jgi:predicted small integral membrane protein
MTEIHQVADDLRFVRTAVETHRRSRFTPSVAYVWAAYVLVGYALIDLAPHASGLFFLVGGVAGTAATAVMARRAQRRTGVIDRAEGRRQFLGWFGGFVLIVSCSIALQLTNPALRGTPGGQVVVVMAGLMYFLAGAYGPAEVRYLVWGGPVVMAGGVCVGLVHHYGWTALGVLIAALILLPTFRSRANTAPVQS